MKRRRKRRRRQISPEEERRNIIYPRFGGVPPNEEDVDLTDFALTRAYLLFQGVYRDFPHHNNGLHLDSGVTENSRWKCCWRRLATELVSWYATPSVAVGTGLRKCFPRNGRVFSTGVETM